MLLRRWVALLLVVLGLVGLIVVRGPTRTSDLAYWLGFLALISLPSILMWALRTRIFQEVKRGEIGVVERFHQLYDATGPGLLPLLPFVEVARIIPTAEQVAQYAVPAVLTNDGLSIAFDLLVCYQVKHPSDKLSLRQLAENVLYDVSDWHEAIKAMSIAALHRTVGGMSMKKVLGEWTTIGDGIKASLQPTGDEWGVDIRRVALMNPRISATLEAALEAPHRAAAEVVASEYWARGEADGLRQLHSALEESGRLKHVAQEQAHTADQSGMAEVRAARGQKAGDSPAGPAPADESRPTDFQYDAFISYSQEDRDWVENVLLSRLERAGLRILVRFRDFEPGVPTLLNIEQGIESSRRTLVVLTPAWVASESANFEGFLLQTKDPAGRRRHLLPLLLKPCELPNRLAFLTNLDFTNPTEFEFQMQRLVNTVRQPDVPKPPSGAPGGKTSVVPAPRAHAPDYERGLAALSEHLAKGDIGVRLHFSELKSRLLDNLRDESLYGAGEPIRSERTRILQELNRLSVQHASRTFSDLCQP